MNKQSGQVVILVLLVVCLTAGLWIYMRWSNYQALQSLNQNIERLDSALIDKTESIARLEEEKQALVDQLVAARSLAERQSRNLAELNQSIVSKETAITSLESAVIEQSTSVDTLQQEKQILLLDINNMTTELTVGQSEVAALAQERDAILAQVKTLEDELATMNQYSQQLNQRYQRVQNELASEIQRSESYSARIESLEQQYASEQSALAALEQQISQYQDENQLLQTENSSLLNDNQQLNIEQRQLIQQYENGISVIRLPNRVLFPVGSAELSPQGREALTIVATTLKAFPEHLISVEGHTDHRPIGGSLFDRFPSNWELSSARAASAIRVLVRENIPAEQFQAVGYADTRPLVEKTNIEQISLNRRIEILLFPPIERQLKDLTSP